MASAEDKNFSFYDDLLSFVHDAASKNWGPTWTWEESGGHLMRTQYANETTIRSSNTSSVIEVERPGLTQESDKVRLIYIPSMMGLSILGELNEFTLTIVKTTLMAVHHFNHRVESIVTNLKELLADCNIRIITDLYDSERLPSRAAKLLSQYIYKRGFPYKPTALIGAGRSSVSIPLAVLNSVRNLPQVSYASTSLDLDNRDAYPMFGRVIASNADDARTSVDYLASLGVTHFGILYVQEDYGVGYRAALEEAAQRQMTTSAVAFGGTQSISDQTSIQDAIIRLKETGYRYFVAVINQQHLEDVVHLAAESGIMGPGYLWLFSDAINVAGLTAQEGTKRASAIHGLGTITAGFSMTRGHYPRFRAELEALHENDEFRRYYLSKNPLQSDIVFPENHTLGTASPLAYDAVMSLGIAACQAEGSNLDGDSLLSSFLNVTFESSSGQVIIDKTTGSRYHGTMPYALFQSVLSSPDEDGVMRLLPVYVGEYIGTVENAQLSSSWTFFTPYNYSGMTSIPPPPLPPLESEVDSIPRWVSTGSMLLACIIMLSSTGFGLWTWRERASQVVKSSQPGFLIAICAGVFLMAASGITFVIESPPFGKRFANFGCMASFWFYFTGFTLAFSALFAKTWRINKILSTGGRFRRIVVNAQDVLLPGAGLLLLNSTVLILWQVLHPLQYDQAFYDDSVDRFGRPNRSYSRCAPEDHGSSGTYFAVAAFSVNSVAILAAFYQAFKARHIATAYSESTFIFLALVCLLQVLLICAPVLALMTGPANSIARACFALVSSSSILYVIFVPKALYWRNRKTQQRAMIHASSRSMGGLKSSTTSGSMTKRLEQQNLSPPKGPTTLSSEKTDSETEEKNSNRNRAGNTFVAAADDQKNTESTENDTRQRLQTITEESEPLQDSARELESDMDKSQRSQ